jgi:uncharacterized protein involved in exopolysaccharide biosynthesis
MNTPKENRAIALSQRVYKRLLRLYPRAHREEYGTAMAQLFRDQCRDAWQAHRGWGLAWLWLHVLPDLFKTAAYERLANRGERKPMFKKTFTEIRTRPAWLALFIVVSLSVFFLVVVAATIVTFMLPEQYSSKARIKVERDMIEAPGVTGRPHMTGVHDPYFIQTEFEVIQSEKILDQVIERLDLNTVWANKYNLQKLKYSESRALLKKMVELRPARNTSLVDITVYNQDPAEAAKIANTVAEVYQTYRREQSAMFLAYNADEYKKLIAELKKQLVVKTNDSKADDDKTSKMIERAARLYMASDGAGQTLAVEIIEHAEPGFRPVRPNKPLNIAIGIGLGLLLGLAAGTLVTMFAIAMRKQPAPAQ